MSLNFLSSGGPTLGASSENDALTFKPDHPMGARHIASTEQGRNLGAVDAIASHLVSLYDQRDWLDFGISTTDQRRSLNVGLSRQKEMYGARTIVYQHYLLNL